MRPIRSIPILIAIGALAVVWAACGAAGAENEAESAEKGFFERLMPADPEPVVVPAGTTLTLRLEDTLSSHETPVGASFTGQVVQEVSVDGQLAIPAGSIVRGHVTEAQAAKKIGGRARLSLAFDELETPDGEVVPIAARLAQRGKSEVGKDAAIIGGSTIGGAILGEAIDEGEGGVIGAVVGGIGGTIGALKTKGKPVVLSTGTMLHIALESSITVEVS
ncbi:MAG: hypothetical protein R3244_05520 [Thermoanaerobaculia bacterium]|nr:hypothetical protein [Thermoanaerobaculia bacterium]